MMRSGRTKGWAFRLASPAPDVHLFGRTLSAYRFFGYGGLALGSLLALGLAPGRGVPPPAVAAAIAGSYAASYGLTLGVKLATGAERLVYFHYLALVLAVSPLVAGALGAGPLATTELIVLDLGLMQAVGRVGCLASGCCHGRPSRWGVVYRAEHGRAGLPPELAGVCLVPVQALEALLLALAVAAAAGRVAAGAPPGEGLALYLAAASGVRLGCERLRGDAARAYRLGLSEAEWTVLGLAAATAAAGPLGWLPVPPATGVAAVAVAVAAVAAGLARRWGRAGAFRLLAPAHVVEIAAGLARLEEEAERSGLPPVAETSLGLRLSARGVAGDGGVRLLHCALSRREPPLTAREARRIAAVVARLGAWSGRPRLVTGRGGVFHALAPPGGTR